MRPGSFPSSTRIMPRPAPDCCVGAPGDRSTVLSASIEPNNAPESGFMPGVDMFCPNPPCCHEGGEEDAAGAAQGSCAACPDCPQERLPLPKEDCPCCV